MKVKSALLGLAAASGGLLMSANVASADGYSAPARYDAAPTWTGWRRRSCWPSHSHRNWPHCWFGSQLEFQKGTTLSLCHY